MNALPPSGVIDHPSVRRQSTERHRDVVHGAIDARNEFTEAERRDGQGLEHDAIVRVGSRTSVVRQVTTVIETEGIENVVRVAHRRTTLGEKRIRPLTRHLSR